MKIKAIFDNGGRTADRYTVVYDECVPGGLYVCLEMSENPFHPQGFGQLSECCEDYANHGTRGDKRIKFSQLPANCQKLVLQATNRGMS